MTGGSDGAEPALWVGMVVWILGALLIAVLLLAVGFVAHLAVILIQAGWNFC